MSYAQPQNPSRQVVGVATVILLHVGIIYALVNGLGHQAIEVIRAPLETKIIEDVKPPPPDVPPPPPPVLKAPPPPYIPPPEIRIQQPPPPTAIAAVTSTKPTQPFAPPARAVVEAPHEVVRVPPVIDAAKGCHKPEYPAVSRRLQETGTVVLQFLIDVDGSVLESKVESSTGYDRLDEAARATLSQCKFKAGSVDGKPEQSWAKIRYTWKLE